MFTRASGRKIFLSRFKIRIIAKEWHFIAIDLRQYRKEDKLSYSTSAFPGVYPNFQI